jgi:hypothetical protein
VLFAAVPLSAAGDAAAAALLAVWLFGGSKAPTVEPELVLLPPSAGAGDVVLFAAVPLSAGAGAAAAAAAAALLAVWLFVGSRAPTLGPTLVLF